VVFLDHTAALSGGELALWRLISAAAGTDLIDPYVILAQDGPLAERLRATGISVEILELCERTRNLHKDRVTFTLPGLAVLDTVAYSVRLSRRLRQLRPDIVHSNSLKSGVYGALAAKLAGVPLVWHLRDRLAEGYMSRPAQGLIRLLIRRLATVVICNSESTRRAVGRQPAAVVLPSIAASGPQTPFPVEHGPGRTLRIGLVGRIARWKGQDLFLRAFADAFPDGGACAVIVGAPLFGSDEERYAEILPVLTRELGISDRVDFRGHRDDIAAELSSLDVLVHASTIPEPFGQVIVEGMAAGLPVLAAHAGGPEEIITNWVDGFLYPMGDGAALASAMRTLAGDPSLRLRIGAAAIRTAATYSPQVIVPNLLDIYDSALR
jgi:glycosyltransferase involved in cell wall biosynthesis